MKKNAIVQKEIFRIDLFISLLDVDILNRFIVYNNNLFSKNALRGIM